MKKPKYRIADKVRLTVFAKGYHYCIPEKKESFEGPGRLGAIVTIRDIRITDDGDVWYTFMDYDNWVTEDAIEGSVPNFVVGKWYTFDGNYGKLTSYPEPPKFPSTEWIDQQGRYHDSGTFFIWTPENIKEADMSEVSKHLPYGHPDKIKPPLEPDEVKYILSKAPITLMKPHDDLPTSISLSRMYESIYGKDLQTTSPKTKNEHVIHQSPVLIGKKKPFKQLFIINN